MSSNLTAEAKLAYSEFLDAKTLDDKIERLERFLSLVPKHKATERIVALNKTRLSKLKAEREDKIRRRKALAAAVEDPFVIKKEPQSVQIMLVSDYFDQDMGAGKSTFLKNMTGVSHLVPGVFTAEPVVGIYEWKKIKFQIVEEPALHDSQYLSRVIAGLKVTDIIALMVDLSRDPLKQMENILKHLHQHHLYLNREAPKVKIEKTGAGGIQIFLMTKDAKKNENNIPFIKEMVQASGISHATVKIYQELSIDEIEMAFNRSSKYKPALIIASKADLPNTKENFNKLQMYYGKGTKYEYSIYPIAFIYDKSRDEIVKKGLNSFEEDILRKLKLIRIYTKSKKGIADKPLIVPKSSTVGEVAIKIHKDLYNGFKFAYIYRTRSDGQETRIRAGMNFVLNEFDIIEIFSKI
ncbi:TGS domain-containing protein [Candidatus Harpocratesius sp.]